MAMTTGIKLAGYVIVNDNDARNGACILCRDGVWMSLASAQAGQKPLATSVRVCRYRTEAVRYARRHTIRLTNGYVIRPRILSAHAAGITEVR
jgi:hypothetical protein